MKRSAPIVLAVLAACAAQRPQVLTPVRIDTTRAPAVASSVGVLATNGAGRARSIDTDLLARGDRMEWPGPNTVRSASGAPGPEYWQQRADYSIAVTLDTARQRIAGSVTIRYTNNSVSWSIALAL